MALTPIRRAVRMIRRAISPRLAIRTESNTQAAYGTPLRPEHRTPAHQPAQRLDHLWVVFGRGVQLQPLHRGRGAAWLYRAADEVVERVGRADDAAAQRRLLPPLRGPARVALPSHDVGDRVEHPRLLDDLSTVLGDPPLLFPGHEHGGASGDGVAQRQLADVVHQRRVLQLEQSGLGHAKLASDGYRQAADPGRVPDLHVPADL